jgi:hypothetical protein
MSLVTIPILEHLRISSPDPMNFTVERRRIVEKGKNAGQEQWDTLGYFSSLGGAANSLLTGHLMDYLSPDHKEVVMDLKMVVSAIDEAADHIARSCAAAAPKLSSRVIRTPVVSGEME